ncbi:MAG: hypothetical protein ACT6Q8_21670 [Niveispirillum sp.]|uniref:hypothetical protein n=1 Tax=Niveispirillum sp. TaxID=1917217 RepID=UPI004035F20A
MTNVVMMEGAMREVQLRDAKAGLSALVDADQRDHTPSFARMLMSCSIDADDLPSRQPGPVREIIF